MMNKEKKNRLREIAQKKAKVLVSQMSVEEMASQLRFDAPAIDRLKIPEYNWWSEGLHGVARAGTATMFPQAIGLGATFDEELLEEVGEVISTEARAKYNEFSKYDDRDIYKGLTLWSPNVNLFRDPRWGRGHETYGEDPYLISRLGVRFIEGMQGEGDTLRTAACAKHFAVHSGPEALRHEFNAEASMKDIWETYLPAFEACVKEADVESVMGAYNRTNGEVCCAHTYFMQEVLRDLWDFKGHFVSDCWALLDFHTHHMVTKTVEESVMLALEKGCDVNCGCVYQSIMLAYKTGELPLENIQRSTERLFTTRFLLGIMDETEKLLCEQGLLDKDIADVSIRQNDEENSIVSNIPKDKDADSETGHNEKEKMDAFIDYNDIPYEAVECKKHLKLARKAAEESIVLLKNNGVLPLCKDKIQTIGVVGPNADSRKALMGNYHGTASRYITVLEGIQDYVKDDVRVLYSQGCHLFLDKEENLARNDDRLSEVKAVAEHSDLLIVCVGLDETLEGEEGDTGNAYASGDKLDLKLPPSQVRLLETVKECGKPFIVLVMAGSAMDLQFADTYADAVLQVWYPGASGGKTVADLLFGELSPSGKLPITLYRDLSAIPEFTDYSMKGRTYRYLTEKPLYPFGYGLTYADTKAVNAVVSKVYDENIQIVKALSRDEIKRHYDALANPAIKVTVTVKNEGTVDTQDVLQVYVKNENAMDALHPHLAAFKRIKLKAGETDEVKIKIPMQAFTSVDEEGYRFLEMNKSTVYVGFGQPDERTKELTGSESLSLEVSLS